MDPESEAVVKMGGKRARLATAVDLFSGCGGLSEGLRRAGFKVVAAVEVASKPADVYRTNHPSTRLYEEDVRLLDGKRLMADCGLAPGELGLLAGCPPCQGFSRLRTRNKATSVADDRNSLVLEFFRLALEMQPKTIMLENVPALERDINFVDGVERLREAGYEVRIEVLDASRYSVPQRRRRLIMLASRVHVPVDVEPHRKVMTVKDAIGFLGEPGVSCDPLHALPERRSPAVKRIMSLIPKDGGSRADLPKKYQLDCHLKSNGFSDVYGRMRWDAVSPTITSGCNNPSKGRFIHPVQDRAISLREASLLQGFPLSYVFDVKHGKEAIALMIGNALPPPFIAAHAKQLRDAVVP